MKIIARFMADDSAATAIEYALIAAATGLALGAVMPLFQTNITSTWQTIGNLMK